MNLLRRLRCALTGHPDTWIGWGAVRQLSGDRTIREAAELCGRCDAVVNRATLRLEGERWRA